MVILTRKLREYLESPETFSPNYRRVLKHLLKHRIMKALKEIEEIEEKAPWVIKELSLEDLGVREVAGSNPARSNRRGVKAPGPLNLFYNIVIVIPPLACDGLRRLRDLQPLKDPLKWLWMIIIKAVQDCSTRMF